MTIDDRRVRFLFQAWRSGSMRAAADVLEVAPSSISRQIAQLEREVGNRLIEHGQREIRLTEAGQAVIEYYRTRQACVEALRGQLLDISTARSGQMQLALGEGFLGKRFTTRLMALWMPGRDLNCR
ncbi:LysR family transcriptional regulator [Ochrobactrum cytisi]|nr:LysR family transcriptional regulator [Brucella cytisi]